MMINIYQREEIKEFLRTVEPFYGLYDEQDLDNIVDRINEIMDEYDDRDRGPYDYQDMGDFDE